MRSRPAVPPVPSTHRTETRSLTTATTRLILSVGSRSPVISAVILVGPELWKGTKRETVSDAPAAIIGIVLVSI